MDFLNVLFLAAGGTALVPIIIHLVQRRRVQQVIFGSLRFLRKTPHRVIHRRRFEEFLLVLLRALALALAAVAFARPLFQGALDAHAEGKRGTGEEAVLLLVDNSYSMNAGGRLERAKQEALKFLREVDPAAKVGVAACSSQFDELCPVGSKASQAEEAVKNIKPSWRGTKLALALNQAGRLLARADRRESRRRIVLVSDFHASAWQERADWTMPAGIDLEIRNVASRPVPNVFIERVAVPRLVVAGGFVEVITANIRNLTEKPMGDAVVTFRVGGEVKAAQSVNIRPGEEAPVRFRHKFAEPGDVTGSLAVRAADGMPDDNAAHFCVHVTPRVHVLLVNADRAEKMVLNDGLFLTTALVPEAGDAVSPFEVRQVGPEEMKPADLDGVDVVLLVNVSKVPAAVTRAAAQVPEARDAEFTSPLGRFVAAGGGIGFICGSKVDPEEFNQTFGGLAPCRLARLAMEAGDPPVVINQVDLRHEIFAEFAQPHSGDFSLAEFSQYFLVTDSLRAQVPARFSSKDAHPAILERVFGQESQVAAKPKEGDEEQGRSRPKGKSILLVSSMDLEWNNLCLKSVFVPFVHQLAKRLCARQTGSVRNFVVSEEITYAVPKGAGEVRLRRQADGSAAPGDAKAAAAPKAGEAEWEKPVELKVQPAGEGGAVTFAPEKPGIYELVYNTGAARFAVNLDPKEPDFRPLDTRLLLATVQKGPAVEAPQASGGGSVAAKSTVREQIENRQKIWWYVLAAVLAALAAEMWLAARIGRA
jgi:hypothetical protein